MTTYWKQCLCCKDSHRSCDGQFPCSKCVTRKIDCIRRVRTPATPSTCKACSKTAWYGVANTVPTHCRDHREPDMVSYHSVQCAYEGCVSTSHAFGFPGQKGTHCKKHAEPGMVNVVNRLCDHAGCTSTSRVFGLLKSKKRYCKAHSTSMMVNLVTLQCEHPNCSVKSKNFDVPGGKGRFCQHHRKVGMIDVRNASCIHPGCKTRASFSIKGQPARYCAEHKLNGMINRNSCEHEGCGKYAGYNNPGISSGRFCSAHKLDGMISVNRRYCKHPGCEKNPSFGIKTPQFCKIHAEDGMKNLIAKLCEYPDCDIHPAYNVPGQRSRFCQKHAEPGMELVVGKGCQHPGCKCRSHHFDNPGGKGRFCTKHKDPGMVDVLNPICEECDTLASYGIPGGKKTRCSKHRTPGMITRPRAKCVVCRKPALYGQNFIPIHCEAHKEDEDDNLVERKCVSCHLVMVLDRNDKCEYCDPVRFQTARLAKQNALMEYLDRKGLKGNSTDIVIDRGTCGLERPDRVFDFEDKIVILECDEHQHKDRQCLCEQARMVNISQSYGGMPVYFIRWNPDNYTSIDTKLPDSIPKRHKLVADYIQEIQESTLTLPKGLLSVLYMYYDGWTGLPDTEWTVITPFQEA